MITSLSTSAYEDVPGSADDNSTSREPEQERQTQENDPSVADAGSDEKEHKGSGGPEEKDITD